MAVLVEPEEAVLREIDLRMLCPQCWKQRHPGLCAPLMLTLFCREHEGGAFTGRPILATDRWMRRGPCQNEKEPVVFAVR